MINTFLPPAQLWIGHHELACTTVEQYIQTILCAYNACNTCNTCIQIRNKQHASLLWLTPEKQYTLEQLELLFHTISFSLQNNEHFFFVIEKADTLSTACANKLLKPMEEPPPGYHFILIAQRQEYILPTIQSRCIIHTITSSHTTEELHPLIKCLTTQPLSPTDFTKILETTNPSEHETLQLFDNLFAYWLECYSKNINSSEQQKADIKHIISLLKIAYLQPPMPGSSMLFWRNIYLQINHYLSL